MMKTSKALHVSCVFLIVIFCPVIVLGESGDKSPVSSDVAQLTVQSAVFTAIDNNISFSLSKYTPRVKEAVVTSERGTFEGQISAGTSWRNSDLNVRDDDSSTYVSLEKFYPSGTTVSVGMSYDNGSSSSVLTNDDNSLSTDLFVTRALLQGAGSDVNLARLKSAQLGVEISTYELMEAAQNLVAEVEKKYWDLRLAKEQLKIYRESLSVAEGQLSEIKERIRLGKLAGTEMSAAEAEMASRREDLINAKSSVTKNRLQLLRLLNMPGEGFWSREFSLEDEIILSQEILDEVNAHVALALKDSPILNQARLQVEQSTLEVVRTKNGLLPRLDAFIGFSSSSYSNSFYSSDDRDSDVQVGLVFSTGLGRRTEKGNARKAFLTEQQVREALLNLMQLTQQDLRIAYVEVERSLAQVVATKATRQLRKETADSEKAKFRIGKSTSLLVAQAARDLVIAKVAEVEAQISVKKALVELYLIEGSLLRRKGIISL